MRCTLSALTLMLAFMIAGCSEDPAKDVPHVSAGPAQTVATDASKPTETKEATAAPTSTPSPAGALVISGTNSKLEFVGSKKLGGTHNGGFKTFSGVVELVEGKPEVKSISVEIDSTSIFSDDEKLTGHLKNADFFDVAKFPTSKFVTTEIKTGGDKGATHTLVGNLTLHGVTKSITIPATLKVDGGVMTLKSEFALNKNDFGMTFSGGGVIRDEVVLKLDIKGEKKG